MNRRLLRAGHHGARYLAGAVLCAGANNVVLIGGNALGWPDFAGVVASWFVGGTIGYAWHSRITYGSHLTATGYARFLGGAALGIPLAYAAIWLFHQRFGWPMWIAAPATTVALFCYHYANARLAVTLGRRTRAPHPTS